jgi:hypothetical protein
MGTFRFPLEILGGEGRLARAIRTGNDDNAPDPLPIFSMLPTKVAVTWVVMVHPLWQWFRHDGLLTILAGLPLHVVVSRSGTRCCADLCLKISSNTFRTTIAAGLLPRPNLARRDGVQTHVKLPFVIGAAVSMRAWHCQPVPDVAMTIAVDVCQVLARQRLR